MSRNWYIEHNGNWVGPVTSAQLKQLARTNKINSETRIRPNDNDAWIPASQLKGLFDTDAAATSSRIASDALPRIRAAPRTAEDEELETSTSATAKPAGLVIAVAVMLIAIVFGILVKGGRLSPRESLPSTSDTTVLQEPIASPPAPFAFRVVDRDTAPHTLGPQVALTIETTSEVARSATEAQMRQLWNHLTYELGANRAFLTLVAPQHSIAWAVLKRTEAGGAVDIAMNQWVLEEEEEGQDEGTKASRAKRWGQMLAIRDRLLDQGWQAGPTQADFLNLKWRDPDGFGSGDVSMTPGTLQIFFANAPDEALTRTIASVRTVFNDDALLPFVNDKLKSPGFRDAIRSGNGQHGRASTVIDGCDVTFDVAGGNRSLELYFSP